MSASQGSAYRGQDGYVKFVLILMKCSSSVLRRVLSTYVIQTHQTLEQLIQTHDSAIRAKPVGKWNHRVLHPVNGTATNLEHWDLSLLCCVLEIVNIPSINSHVEELKYLRNFICHIARPSLQEADYNTKTRELKTSLSEFMNYINDARFKEDIENEIDDIAETSRHTAVNDQIGMMYQWLTVDNDIRETLQVMRMESRKGHQVTQESVETLRAEQKESFDKQQKHIDILTTEVSKLHVSIRQLSQAIGLPPDASVEIIQHNITDEQRQGLSKRLVRYFSEIVVNRGLADDLANDQRDQLHVAVEEAYDRLHKRGNDISQAEDGSVRLKIHCQKYDVLVDFLEDCIVGNITQCFRPLEEAIRDIEGFENYTQDVVILKDDYLNCIREISEKMEKCKAEKDEKLKMEQQEQRKLTLLENKEQPVHVEDIYLRPHEITEVAAGLAEMGGHFHRSTSYLFDSPSDHITCADLVVALDVGSTYSGYAWQWREDFENNKSNVRFNTNWGHGSPQIHKTPTSLLIKTRPDNKSSVVTFGYRAEQHYSNIYLSDKTEEEKDTYHLFRKFKIQLYKMGSGSCESIQTEDTRGQHFPLMEVMTLFIQALKDHFLKNQARDTNISTDRILWVLTVPAIWSERAKMFMRDAAEKSQFLFIMPSHSIKLDLTLAHTILLFHTHTRVGKKNLLLALEPEAATVSCMNLPKQEKRNMFNFSTPGHHFMTVDIGGGTVDLSAVSVTQEGRLEELWEESGACVGGNNVNEWLVTELQDSFKDNAWQTLMTQARPDEVMKMEQMIETFKLQDLEEEFWDMEVPIAIKKAIENKELRLKDKPNQNIKLGGEKIHIRTTYIRNQLFRRSCENIYSVIHKVLKGCADINTVILVGGFAESLNVQKTLNEMIKHDFPTIHVSVPTSPFKAVLMGAVLYGHDTSLYQTRISRTTFGVGTNVEYKWERHDPRKKWQRPGDNKYMCRDVIDVCVWKGEVIGLGENLPTKTYKPNHEEQKKLALPLYESLSKKQAVIYTTDANSRKVGEIVVDLSDVESRDSKEIEIQMTYGGTQLNVRAVNRLTRKEYKAEIVFDN